MDKFINYAGAGFMYAACVMFAYFAYMLATMHDLCGTVLFVVCSFTALFCGSLMRIIASQMKGN
jgi:hypothetical protein